MKLEISGVDKGEPTLDIITRVVNDESFRDEFFIIIKDDGSYLQATGPNSQLHVEYRDIHTGNHYYCASSITCDDLVKLCMNYISEQEGWNNHNNWRPLEEFHNQVKTPSNVTWNIEGL